MNHTSTDRPTETQIIQPHCHSQKDVTESLAYQSHSLTDIARISLNLSEQRKVKARDSQMDCGMIQAELHSQSSEESANINDCLSVTSCNGVMGVPITFIDKFNPEQFEIIGCSDNGYVPDIFKLPHFKKHNEPYIDGNKKYTRIFIRRKR